MSPLVDLDGLNAWTGLADVPGEGPVESVETLPGGAQNLLFTIRRTGGTELVLRRPGRHAGDDAESRFRRESRVLSALAKTDIPHPRLYASCTDESVIGVPFSILERIDGFTPKGQLPGQYGADPSWRRDLALELVGGAASLSLVDPKVVGLEDLGKPEGWLDRQVPRYLKLLERYREDERYRAQESPYVDVVAEWLRSHRPATAQVGIVHGDFQFANVMFRHDAPRLAAIVDWEMASLGDPLLDLAWILTAWREEGDPPGSDPYVLPWEGMPPSSELIEHYVALTGRDVSDFRWFQVLACFRLAALLEGSFVRALDGRMDRTTGEVMHQYSLWLFAKAEALVSAPA